MKIIDSNGVEIANPDLTKGYLKQETQTVRHDAVEGVEEVSHYETIREYPNGGKDVKKVVDVKAVPAQDAYDEEVEVQRYILYTAEELAAQADAKKKAEEVAAAEAKKKAELEAVPGRMDALEAANDDLVLMMADLIGG
jgi:uncharacterized sporulation protein YeaH/YhbH (DUF444 family)